VKIQEIPLVNFIALPTNTVVSIAVNPDVVTAPSAWNWIHIHLYVEVTGKLESDEHVSARTSSEVIEPSLIYLMNQTHLD